MSNKNKRFILSILVFTFSIALVNAWTNLPSVSSGATLTSTIWNDLITQVNETGNRVSGIFTDGSSNVGVGTSSPTTKLDVNGTIKSNLAYSFKTTGTHMQIYEDFDSAGWTRFRPYVGNGFYFSDNGDTPIFTIGEGGNVGVGTSNPSSKFEVVGGTSSLQQETWINVTFQNSWVNYGGAYAPISYFKDSNGVVHLRGLAASGSVGGAYCIFTLPSSYRPVYNGVYMVQTSVNTYGRIDIKSNGCVAPVLVDNTRVSLDGLTFPSH